MGAPRHRCRERLPQPSPPYRLPDSVLRRPASGIAALGAAVRGAKGSAVSCQRRPGTTGTHSEPRTTSPQERRPGCPCRPPIGSPPLRNRGNQNMLRLQLPLPERYTDASDEELESRIAAAKATLGERLFILGHHYQRDEIIQFADARGDSYRLSVLAQERPEAEYIVFCGVHFMAESADILTGDHQQVILPDLNAGCSMADMADIDQVEEAWEQLERVIDIDRLVPITYMNSLGRAEGVRRPPRRRRLHLDQRPGGARVGVHRRATRCCSSPTSTSAATPASRWATRSTTCSSGTPASSSAASPRPRPRRRRSSSGRATARSTSGSRPEQVADFRAEHPDGLVVVHPESPHEAVLVADVVGSTDFIIKTVEAAAPGTTIAVGTEIHLVNRLAPGAPGQDRRVARPAHLPVLDDEPHRPSPPGVGAGGARRRTGAEPDHGRSQHRRIGAGCPRSDAQHLIAERSVPSAGDRPHDLPGALVARRRGPRSMGSGGSVLGW